MTVDSSRGRSCRKACVLIGPSCRGRVSPWRKKGQATASYSKEKSPARKALSSLSKYCNRFSRARLVADRLSFSSGIGDAYPLVPGTPNGLDIAYWVLAGGELIAHFF